MLEFHSGIKIIECLGGACLDINYPETSTMAELCSVIEITHCHSGKEHETGMA